MASTIPSRKLTMRNDGINLAGVDNKTMRHLVDVQDSVNRSEMAPAKFYISPILHGTYWQPKTRTLMDYPGFPYLRIFKKFNIAEAIPIPLNLKYQQPN